jgi:hypothetical protein
MNNTTRTVQSAGKGNFFMAANTTPNFEFAVSAEKAIEDCATVTLKQRLSNLLCDVFQGRGEYLGLTPD